MQRAASAPNFSALTVATPEIRPSAGVLRISSSTLRRRRCAAIASEPYSTKRAGIDQVGDVLPRRALVGLAPPLDRRRAVLVQRDRVALDQFGQVGADVVEIDILFLGDIIARRPRPAQIKDRLALHQRDAGLSRDLVTLPPCGAATRCSIFMDSSTAICWPGRTRSPRRHRWQQSCPAAAPAPRPRPSGPVADAATACCERRVIGGAAGFDQRRPRRRAWPPPTKVGDMLVDETGAETVARRNPDAPGSLQEGNVGGDALDPEFAQGARGLVHDVGPVAARRCTITLASSESKAALVR